MMVYGQWVIQLISQNPNSEADGVPLISEADWRTQSEVAAQEPANSVRRPNEKASIKPGDSGFLKPYCLGQSP